MLDLDLDLRRGLPLTKNTVATILILYKHYGAFRQYLSFDCHIGRPCPP